MNCRECEERLQSYVDRELSEQELLEVQRHLEACPPCENHFRLQLHLKRLVKVCCESGQAPAHLRAKLRQILF